MESRVYEDEDEEEDEEDGEVYQTTCPSCGEEIFFDETILEDGGVRCPDCGMPDKFQRTGMHAVPSTRVDAPVVEEYPVTLECKAVELQQTSGIAGRFSLRMVSYTEAE